MHVTAFRGCVGNRAYERDHIMELFRAQAPLTSSVKNIISSYVIYKVVYFNDLKWHSSSEVVGSVNSNKICFKKCTYVEIRGKLGEKTQTCTNYK